MPVFKPLRENAALLTTAHWVLFGLFLGSLGLVAARALGAASLPGNPNWPVAWLALAAAGSTLLSLSRQLPGQNVLLAAAIMGGLGSVFHLIGGWDINAARPILGGPANRASAGMVAWWIPLIWIVALLNSRGAARLALRRARQLDYYGILLLILATVLSLVFIVGVEAFALSGDGSWFLVQNPATRGGGIPLGHYLVFPPATVIILALTTPALINKRPAPSLPDWSPLVTWTLLNLLFAAVAAANQYWVAAALSMGASLAVLAFGVRGISR